MIGWLIAAVLLAGLLMTKLGVRLSWKDNTFSWKVRVALLRFSLSGHKKIESEPKPKKKKKSPKQAEKIKTYLNLVKIHWQDILEIIKRVVRAPVLERLFVNIQAGGKDPEVCAMTYGRICAGISSVLPVISHVFTIKKQQIQVDCRFDLLKTEISAEGEIILRVYEAISLAVFLLGKFIKIRSTMNNQKAV